VSDRNRARHDLGRQRRAWENLEKGRNGTETERSKIENEQMGDIEEQRVDGEIGPKSLREKKGGRVFLKK